jgi:hypothetical protein
MEKPLVLPAMMLTALLVMAGALTASSEMDIDYSHNIVGTGTVMTDYRMGSSQTTEAMGRVRGTGEVMNKYLFQSANDSKNVTIEDQFLLSTLPAAREITLADYPQMTRRPGSFRLLGTAGLTALPGGLAAAERNMSSNTSSGQS